MFTVSESTYSLNLKILRRHREWMFRWEGQKKKNEKSEFSEVGKCLHKWLQQCTNKNNPISGTLLKQKAHQFAEMLDIKDKFRTRNAWLKGFKKRHNLVCYIILVDKGPPICSEGSLP